MIIGLLIVLCIVLIAIMAYNQRVLGPGQIGMIGALSAPGHEPQPEAQSRSQPIIFDNPFTYLSPEEAMQDGFAPDDLVYSAEYNGFVPRGLERGLAGVQPRAEVKTIVAEAEVRDSVEVPSTPAAQEPGIFGGMMTFFGLGGAWRSYGGGGNVSTTSGATSGSIGQSVGTSTTSTAQPPSARKATPLAPARATAKAPTNVDPSKFDFQSLRERNIRAAEQEAGQGPGIVPVQAQTLTSRLTSALGISAAVPEPTVRPNKSLIGPVRGPQPRDISLDSQTTTPVVGGPLLDPTTGAIVNPTVPVPILAPLDPRQPVIPIGLVQTPIQVPVQPPVQVIAPKPTPLPPIVRSPAPMPILTGTTQPAPKPALPTCTLNPNNFTGIMLERYKWGLPSGIRPITEIRILAIKKTGPLTAAVTFQTTTKLSPREYTNIDIRNVTWRLKSPTTCSYEIVSGV